MKKLFLATILLMSGWAVLLGAETLDMYVVDTEGGKALLILSPSGQSMLIDAGFQGFEDRDAIRIEEAAKAANIRQFDVLVVTHYDMDHVNNVPATVARVPAKAFFDHGAPVMSGRGTSPAVRAYEEVAAKAKRTSVKPGDKIPFEGVDVQVVTSAGKTIQTPVQGGGLPNPFCEGATVPREDRSENGQSLGLLFTFGKFRMLDLADLTSDREQALMCPTNLIGTVDLFMVSHHGNDVSNSKLLVHALKPKVAIMNNGPSKFGLPSVIKTIRSSPGLEALYQLHWSVPAGDVNPPDEYLANLQDSPDGKWIKVSVQKDGSFTVTNARTGGSKTFKP
jgi:competence protein ComEC